MPSAEIKWTELYIYITIPSAEIKWTELYIYITMPSAEIKWTEFNSVHFISALGIVM
jgi:hypothetical protein